MGFASRLSSITSRMPLRSEWSWTSEISVSFFSLTRSTIFLMTPLSPPFLTMNGSSVTTIASRLPRICSKCAVARTRTRPRPVS